MSSAHEAGDVDVSQPTSDLDKSKAIQAKPMGFKFAEDPQEKASFFQLPGEIRDRLYRFIIVKNLNGRPKPRSLQTGAYQRPDHLYEEYPMASDLLATCQRILTEARYLVRASQSHPLVIDPTPFRRSSASDSLKSWDSKPLPHEHTLNLEIQQHYLESTRWPIHMDRFVHTFTNIRRLHLNIRHFDWWMWNSSDEKILSLEPWHSRDFVYQEGATKFDRTRKNGWGTSLKRFEHLFELELELEQTEDKSAQLDAVVKQAAEWEFPMGENKSLVHAPEYTTRKGWAGMKFSKKGSSSKYVVCDLDEAETRLKSKGVEILKCQTNSLISRQLDFVFLYAVTMTWHLRRTDTSVAPRILRSLIFNPTAPATSDPEAIGE